MGTDLGKGVSFPFRLGARGQVTLSKSDYYEDTHIKESIKQILLTNTGERPMEPEFGSNLKNLLFSPNNTSLNTIAINFAYNALKRWEPRISVTNITLEESYGEILIRIEYIIVATEQPGFVYVPYGKVGDNS
jgi:phage baseplate assembly protein W